MADLGVESLIRAVIAAGESSMILVLVSPVVASPSPPWPGGHRVPVTAAGRLAG